MHTHLDSILIIETLADGQERVLQSSSHLVPILYLQANQVPQ
jgi:hypothetical protein